MDMSNIIKDSFKYPLGDMKQFFVLAIPNIILGVIFGILMLVFSFSTPEGLQSLVNNNFTTVSVSMIVIYVLILVFTIINSGIGVSVIRKTIGESNQLPEFDPNVFLISGIKALIVEIVLYVIPLFVLLMLFAVAIALKSSIFALIMIILFIVVAILLGLILPICLARLAETDDMGEALSISNIWEIAKTIGLVNIFCILVLVSIITGIISFVSELLLGIPIIGAIISIGLFDTYILLFTSRANGLLYLDRYNRNQFTNNPYQQYPNTQDQYQQYPPSQGQYQQDNMINSNTQQLDFNPDNTDDNQPVDNKPTDLQQEAPVRDDNTTNQVIPDSGVKKCSQCGYENPDFIVVCMNCGKEL